MASEGSHDQNLLNGYGVNSTHFHFHTAGDGRLSSFFQHMEMTRIPDRNLVGFSISVN
jgi:hypothetical protein